MKTKLKPDHTRRGISDSAWHKVVLRRRRVRKEESDEMT